MELTEFKLMVDGESFIYQRQIHFGTWLDPTCFNFQHPKLVNKTDFIDFTYKIHQFELNLKNLSERKIWWFEHIVPHLLTVKYDFHVCLQKIEILETWNSIEFNE